MTYLTYYFFTLCIQWIDGQIEIATYAKNVGYVTITNKFCKIVIESLY